MFFVGNYIVEFTSKPNRLFAWCIKQLYLHYRIPYGRRLRFGCFNGSWYRFCGDSLFFLEKGSLRESDGVPRVYRSSAYYFELCFSSGLGDFFVRALANGRTAVLVDGLVFVFGLIIPILNIKAYIESALLNIVNCAMQAVMWAQIIITNGNLATLTYLIYSIYCTYMVVRTFLRWLSLYKEQQALNNKKDKAEVEKNPA